MEDEINLRDLIEVLIRGKRVIALITAVAVLVSAILSWFVLTPVYHARVQLMVAFPVRQQPAALSPDGGLNEILRPMSTYPDLSLESYRQQIENPVLLQKVIEELRLPMNRSQLDDAVEVKALKDTNLIDIVVSDSSPERAAQIANKLADLYTKHMTQVEATGYQNSIRTIEAQIEDQDRKLQQAFTELKGFLGQTRGVEELKAETDAKTKLVADYKTQQVKLDVEARALEAQVQSLRADLSAEPLTLETHKVLADDSLLQQIVGAGTGDLARAASLEVRSEEINPVYTALAQELAGLKAELAANDAQLVAIKLAVPLISGELGQLQSEMAEKQVAQDLLQQKVDTLKTSYQIMAQKLDELRIAEFSGRMKQNIILVSPAIVPIEPIKPRRMLNVAIAGMLGLMLSTFLVFFLDYWRRSAPVESVTAGIVPRSLESKLAARTPKAPRLE